VKVFILATCRKPDLAPFTELIFNTLRVGFPMSDVHVHINKGCAINCPSLTELCVKSGCLIERVDTIHHEWIENLIQNENEPFYVLDTDVVFYKNFEDEKFETALAGWRIPEWRDEFSGCITRARLHTSLLYINPVMVRDAVSNFKANIPNTPFTPISKFCHPLIVPFKRERYFYDTCSMLYHAIGGTPFTDAQKDAFMHFNFGTISDVVLPRLHQSELMAVERNRIIENPELGRGQWRKQEEYYNARPV